MLCWSQGPGMGGAGVEAQSIPVGRVLWCCWTGPEGGRDWEGAGAGVVWSFQRDSLHSLGAELITKCQARHSTLVWSKPMPLYSQEDPQGGSTSVTSSHVDKASHCCNLINYFQQVWYKVWCSSIPCIPEGLQARPAGLRGAGRPPPARPQRRASGWRNDRRRPLPNDVYAF